MKYLIILALLVVAVNSLPQKDAVILKSSNDNEGTGNYHWDFESSDGIKQDQTGQLKKNPNSNEPDFQTAQGSFTYATPDGKNVLVTYTADEGGYRVKTSYL